MREKVFLLVGLVFMLGACAEASLPSNPLRRTQTVVFSDSLYRPGQIYEKVSCDIRDGCYVVNDEMEAGLLIGNLIRSGRRNAAVVSREDLNPDKMFIYALAVSPTVFEAEYSQRKQMDGLRRTQFAIHVRDEQALLQNQIQARNIVREQCVNSQSDAETIRLLHDWVVANTGYDEAAVRLDEEQRRSSPAFQASGVFELGKAACSGYMEAMFLLLEEAGIGSVRVFSAAMDHAWNLVNAEGEMRYLDATFDDPVPDRKGRVLYDYFLISGEKLNQSGMYVFDQSTSYSLSQEEYEVFFRYLFPDNAK